MNIMHRLEVRNGVLQNVMYIYYPTEYEFALDFDSLKTHVISVTDKVREYALKNISRFSSESILLILNGVVVGTVLLTQLVADTNLKNIPQNISQNISKINVEKPKNIEVSQASLKEISKAETQDFPEDPNSPSNLLSTTNYTSTNSGSVSNLVLSESTTIIPLKLSDGKIIQIGLEDYIVGVVGSEMPAEFNTEALKAQAVAARTYALKKVAAGITLTTNSETQSYKSEKELKDMWGNSFNKYYTKVKNAVYSTSRECITYNGNLIDALYFSTSNGKTEEPINVWGYSAPYLKSVDSSFEIGANGYEATKTFSKTAFCNTLGIDEPSLTNIKIIEKTTGDRIKKISIGGKIFGGVELRTLLGLRSTDFSISTSGDNVIVTTRGYGHGVGMSQRGAHILATQNGWNYQQILKYYYTGVEITKK
ncbi:MAG: stage II sporulation protein D [Clostridia bacterium]|nr:stage II sporulation protein D [Clostridia bacterium]